MTALMMMLMLCREEWSKNENKIKYSRYNHASVTVPGDMFPQCN